MDEDLLTIARLARLLERACGEIGAPLTLAQYRLLAMIAGGSDRASHLARLLSLAKPTVSATVDTLVERGLVERAPAHGDRRATTLTATAAGWQVLVDAEDAMRARFDAVLEHIDDAPTVSRTLTALGRALDVRRATRGVG